MSVAENPKHRKKGRISREKMRELNLKIARARSSLARLVFPQLMEQLWTALMAFAPEHLVKTAAVTQDGTVLINPNFLDRLNEKQTAFILAHEFLHRVLLGHERFAAFAREAIRRLEWMANEISVSIPPRWIISALGEEEARVWADAWTEHFGDSFSAEIWKNVIWQHFCEAANRYEDLQINALLLIYLQVHPDIFELPPTGMIPADEEIGRLFQVSHEELLERAFENAVVAYPVRISQQPDPSGENERNRTYTLEEVDLAMRRFFLRDPGSRPELEGSPTMDHGYSGIRPDSSVKPDRQSAGRENSGNAVTPDEVRTHPDGSRDEGGLPSIRTGGIDDEVRRRLIEQLKNLFRKVYGRAPGRILDEVVVQQEKVIRWDRVIRDFVRVRVSEHLNRNWVNKIPDWSRRNRRLTNTGRLYIPRDVYESEVVSLLIFVRDTSGSMSTDTLGRIAGEIISATSGSRTQNILFVDADYVIQELLLFSPRMAGSPFARSFSRLMVQSARWANSEVLGGGEGAESETIGFTITTRKDEVIRWLSRARGRGGTSFRAIFKVLRRMEEFQRLRGIGIRRIGGGDSPSRVIDVSLVNDLSKVLFVPGGVVYFTDTFGEWPDPEDRPACPVLFVTPHEPEEKIPFGEVLVAPELWGEGKRDRRGRK